MRQRILERLERLALGLDGMVSGARAALELLTMAVDEKAKDAVRAALDELKGLEDQALPQPQGALPAPLTTLELAGIQGFPLPPAQPAPAAQQAPPPAPSPPLQMPATKGTLIMTQAQTKTPTVIETVTMTDGRVVDFPGKRRFAKESFQTADGVISVRMDFRNGATRTFILPTVLMPKFAAHGAEQAKAVQA